MKITRKEEKNTIHLKYHQKAPETRFCTMAKETKWWSEHLFGLQIPLLPMSDRG